jgi:hypothetical protein
VWATHERRVCVFVCVCVCVCVVVCLCVCICVLHGVIDVCVCVCCLYVVRLELKSETAVQVCVGSCGGAAHERGVCCVCVCVCVC